MKKATISILRRGVKKYTKPQTFGMLSYNDMEKHYQINKNALDNMEKIMTTPSEGSVEILPSWERNKTPKFNFEQSKVIIAKILEKIESSQEISQLGKKENNPETIYLKWREMELTWTKEIQPLVEEFGFDVTKETQSSINLRALKHSFKLIGSELKEKEENKEIYEEYEKLRTSIYKKLSEKVFGIKVEEYNLQPGEAFTTKMMAQFYIGKFLPDLKNDHDTMVLIQSLYKSELSALEFLQSDKKEKKLGMEAWINYRVQLEDIYYK